MLNDIDTVLLLSEVVPSSAYILRPVAVPIPFIVDADMDKVIAPVLVAVVEYDVVVPAFVVM
jgi:hypothetical protein